jgi:hypothetical protein
MYHQRLVELQKGLQGLMKYVAISRFYKSAGTSDKYYYLMYGKRVFKRLKLNRKYNRVRKIAAKKMKRTLFMRWETKLSNRCKMLRIIHHMTSGYYNRLTQSAFAAWKGDTFVENTILLYQVLIHSSNQ